MSSAASAIFTPTSKLAIWSLVTSIIGLVYLLAFVASGNMAIAVGYLAVAFWAGILVVFPLVSAIAIYAGGGIN